MDLRHPIGMSEQPTERERALERELKNSRISLTCYKLALICALIVNLLGIYERNLRTKEQTARWQQLTEEIARR